MATLYVYIQEDMILCIVSKIYGTTYAPYDDICARVPQIFKESNEGPLLSFPFILFFQELNLLG